MNEKSFDFVFEVICDYCTSLQNLSSADILVLDGIRKSFRGWHEGYRNRIIKEVYIDE